MPLTPLQEKVREFIVDYQKKHGLPPSYKEIMVATGVSNRMTVYRYIKRMGLKKAYAVPNR